MPEQTAPATATILENDMSKYTAEQVLYAAQLEEDTYDGDLIIVQYLRDYAALLRERESAKAVVTSQMRATACDAYDKEMVGHGETANPVAMRAALEAVAPMLASIQSTDMVCEQHPWSEWPHDDCAGPGMPGTTQYEALVYLAKLASARVPDELKSAPASPLHPLWGDGYLRGWNACRDAMLAAAPKPETEE